MPERRSRREAPAAPTTRQTRQTRSMAGSEALKTPTNSQLPKGSLQASNFPRRFAPHQRTRSHSIESIATEDMQQTGSSHYVDEGKESGMGAIDEDDEQDAPQRGSQDEEGGGEDSDEEGDEEGKEEGDEEGDEEGGEEDDEDDGALSVDEIFEYILPDLATSADRIFDLIDKTEYSQADKKFYNKLRFLGDALEQHRSRLTADEGILIKQDVMLRQLPDDFQKTGQAQQLREATSSANLILLLKASMQIRRGNDALVEPLLAELDEIFPKEFDTRQRPTAAELHGIYDLAFRIRLHLLAKRIKERPSTNPSILAAELFCSEETPRFVKQAKEMLLKGPYTPVGLQDLNKPGETPRAHSERMGNLHSRLSATKNHDEILGHIESVYPLTELIIELGNWTIAMYKRPKGHESHQRHRQSSARKDTPTNLPSARSSARRTNPPAGSRGPSISGKNKGGRDEDGEGMFVPERDSESGSDSEPDEPVVRTGAPAVSYLDGSAKLERSVDPSGGRPSRTPPSNQQASRNALARLNAEEIVNTNRARAATATPRLQGFKRPRQVTEEHEDPDDDFEVDSRPVDQKRRITTGGRFYNHQTPKRSGPSEALVPASQQSRRSASLNASASQPPPEREEFGQLCAEDIIALSQQARTNARLARRPRGPQQRIFWSSEDTLRLIEAVREYNCAWSLMEEKLEFETPRTQQQIRDKARNIKVDFLKADSPLPAGFDGIALGKKERTAVINARRNPDRREDDVDDYGHVNNNYYDPEIGDGNRIMYRPSREDP